jgi:TPR repeat protein
MPVCFECGQETRFRYCERDGMATFLPELVPPGFELLPGQIVDGRYRIEHKLSRGGMGAVYRAVQVRTGGAVAVKTLCLPAQARRFFHEARATAALMPHPNLLEIFDFGQSEDGIFYLAMELLEGESLAQRLSDRHVIGEDQATDIAIQVLEGLSRAHAHKLVHRDLSPGNLFLHRVRQDREVTKLLDFGIAKGPGMSLTLEDQILGTPAYMAPERCLGEKPADPRGDLYALGDLLRRGDKDAGRLAEAAKEYQAGCDRGDVAGCHKLAMVYRGGARGAPRDLVQAALLDGKACEGGELYGCAHRGRMLVLGEGIGRDDREGGDLLRRACEGGPGIPWACAHLGDLYLSGRGVGKDEVRASALYQRACEGGTTGACASLAMLFDSGRGVNRDRARAAGLFQRACDGGIAVACFQLGLACEFGRGVPKDATQAARRYQQACERGDAAGCSHLGDLYVIGKGLLRDMPKGYDLLRKGCRLGSAWGCNYLRDARQPR